MGVLISALALGVQLGATTDAALASVALFNPTGWRAPMLVEVPTGRLGAPGTIDWDRVALRVAGQEIPFSLREGRAHWRARLVTPGSTPRPEDLLVFWCAVPPGEWVHAELIQGKQALVPALEPEEGILRIAYGGFGVTIDASTGLLTEAHSGGRPLLDGEMQARLFRVEPGSYVASGPVGPGYIPQEISFKTQDGVPLQARLVANSPTEAMTEISFALSGASGPALGVTYRVHAKGLLEIDIDERPWRGTSPWLTHAAVFSLPLAGTGESLPYLEDRAPFYGFKDFGAVMKQTAMLHHMDGLAVLSLGEEAVNGRCWSRRVFVCEGDPGAALEALDEGLVVVPRPVEAVLPAGRVQVTAPPAADVPAAMLRKLFEDSGDTPPTACQFELIQDDEMETDDGFMIVRDGPDKLSIRSASVLGLHQAVVAVAEHRRFHGKGVPLIARTPVAPFRGGGFGGGNFEVDFPYGDDAEWEQTLGALLESGMNVFWCLGMWGNWKLPVSYAYMPELRSDDPEAYDESSGVLFKELEEHRAHGLKITRFIQERGGKVCVWLPIGCVPTTFTDQYPEAIVPGSIKEFWGRPKGTPCFTHPVYVKYVDAFLRELIETYPLDGVVLVRDDNGGVCDCPRCTAYVEQSATKSAVWEQYLQIYGWLRDHGFEGMVGVYPYFDAYTPALERSLPADLFVGGHGASTALLARDQHLVGHMPETWLDNLYTNFRLPPSPRVRRLLRDRATFWIGGAYCGTELPWEGIGYFGWEPTATPNSFRYQWGARRFGPEHALAYLGLNDPYEQLWEINARYLLPTEWMKLDPGGRRQVTQETFALLDAYRSRLEAFIGQVDAAEHERWLAHMGLFPVFFEYHLRRMGRFFEIHDIVAAHGGAIDAGSPLPAEARESVLEKYAEIYAWTGRYGDQVLKTPGEMLEHTRHLTAPYKEWMSGCDGWLDPQLPRPQFRGTLAAEDVTVSAGAPFELEVVFHNTGICPWVQEARQRLLLNGDAARLGLPEAWEFNGEPVAPGDRCTIALPCTAPSEPGNAEVTLVFRNPYRVAGTIAEAKVRVTWR